MVALQRSDFLPIVSTMPYSHSKIMRLLLTLSSSPLGLDIKCVPVNEGKQRSQLRTTYWHLTYWVRLQSMSTRAIDHEHSNTNYGHLTPTTVTLTYPTTCQSSTISCGIACPLACPTPGYVLTGTRCPFLLVRSVHTALYEHPYSNPDPNSWLRSVNRRLYYHVRHWVSFSVDSDWNQLSLCTCAENAAVLIHSSDPDAHFDTIKA
jgi:hypothetical protein